jgi:hypothetical protein
MQSEKVVFLKAAEDWSCSIRGLTRKQDNITSFVKKLAFEYLNPFDIY